MLTAANQPVHYLLQFSQPCWATSKEDHWAWVLVFLHPCKDAAITSEQSIPWLQKWSLSKPGLLRYPLDLFIRFFCQWFPSGVQILSACIIADLHFVLVDCNTPTYPLIMFYPLLFHVRWVRSGQQSQFWSSKGFSPCVDSDVHMSMSYTFGIRLECPRLICCG
jgi:hypothetical protein